MDSPSTLADLQAKIQASPLVDSVQLNMGWLRRLHELLILGERIVQKISDELLHTDYVIDVRGKGLMIGIEMDESCVAIVPIAKSKGLLLNVTSDKTVRLLPPLNMTDDECDFLIDAVVQIIRLYAADDRSKPRTE